METTSKVLNELKAALRASYAKQLDQFGPKLLKPKTRQSLESGFADGVQAGVHHVCRMLNVNVKE